MKVKCFGCKAVLDAPDVAAAADAFVAHAKAAHTWKYPEAAIRTYAANYAEAGERISTDVMRRDEIGAIAVFEVSAARVGDWLGFFDVDAFAGNPDWASCYCLGPNEPAPPENPTRAWRAARAQSAERLRCGTTFGYLAYAGGKAAGWVNASLRSETRLFQDVDPEGPAPASVIAISCFVIAPPFRRHGIAAALLDRVIADAAARGAQWIEAYPHTKPEEGAAGHFRGPRAMYDARGFQPVETRRNFTVVRRAA